MKKTITLLLLISATAIAAPTITYPQNNTITQTSYTVNWTDTDDCYEVKEKIGEGGSWESLKKPYHDSNYSIGGKEDGKYYYKVQGSSPCRDWQNDWSNAPYIVVDTTPPTLSSKSPSSGADNVDVADNVVMTFSDDNALNTNFIEDNFSISPDPGGGFTWSGGDELTYNHTGLNHGTEYSVSLQPKDKAGNVGDEYQWSFTTSVQPENVEIQNPSDGDSLIAGNNIDIQASVTGANGTAVQGATVQTSGACSTTLTEEQAGTYTGECTPSQTGNKTLTITASNAGQTAENNITLNIVEEKTLSINIIKPENRSFKRGSTINFKTQPIVEGNPYENASITSPQFYKFTL